MKPKYHFFNNAKYALSGVFAMLKNEVAFRLELCFVLPAFVLSFFMPVSLVEHILLIFVLFLILIVEAINSAIEAAVDLVTKDYHPYAKIAKDCASAAVFFSICLALITWGIVIWWILLC